jgi:hypothetical protein
MRPTRITTREPAYCEQCVIPIWSCSRWGLPCHPCYHACGALLPHPFTLTSSMRRFAFCGTIPGVAPAGCYPAPCLRGARTFLYICPETNTAAIRPSGGLGYSLCWRNTEMKRLAEIVSLRLRQKLCYKNGHPFPSIDGPPIQCQLTKLS